MGTQWDSDVPAWSSGGKPGPDPQGALESACKRLGQDDTRVRATGRREGREPGTFKDLEEEEKLKGKGEGVARDSEGKSLEGEASGETGAAVSKAAERSGKVRPNEVAFGVSNEEGTAAVESRWAEAESAE